MPSAIHDFRSDAIHTFQVRTLQSLGFHTRVTLLNKSNETPKYSTEYRVDVTIYGPDCLIEEQLRGIAHISPKEVAHIDCRQWESSDGMDRIIIFHLIPARLAPLSQNDNLTSIEVAEIWSLIGAQDHHIEYFSDDGFSSGVLYQCGPMNYDKISPSWSTLIQAPKIFLSDTLNSYMSVIHTSFTPNYTKSAHIHCVLLSPNGQCAVKWTETIKPFETRLINFKDILKELPQSNLGQSSDLKFFTLYAVCYDTTVLPLILNFNETHKTLAVEHSLPPNYYGKNIGGLTRAEILKELKDLPFFKDPS